MFEFATKTDLRAFAAKRSLQEQSTLRKSTETASVTSSAFLSHSSKDKELVTGAIILLRNHGAKVYIDEIDPSMPPYTTSETANLLRKRITSCKRFVLLATNNSQNSKWVPWELGVADGVKGLPPIALFPASEKASDTEWAESEYLGLYQKIVWGNTAQNEKMRWLVRNPEKRTASELREWLTGAD